MEYKDLEFENTPPDIVQKASDVCNNLLPSTSRQKYEIVYSNFMDWRMQAKCVQQCVGQKKGLLSEDGTPKSKEVKKTLIESFTKEPWIESIADELVKTCIAEAQNATANQVKPTYQDAKVCNPSTMTLKHCLFKEIQLSCPADKITDKTACDKFQERIKKGFEFYEPPPPPSFDGPKDD